MSMNLLIWPLLLLLLFCLQTTWTNFFPGTYAAPDFFLLFVIYTAMVKNVRTGIAIGFGLGLIQDVLNLAIFGFHAITRMAAGFCIGLVKDSLYKSGAKPYLWIVFMVTMGTKVAYFLILLIFARGQFFLLTGYPMYLLSSLFWNLLFALPIWYLFTAIERWLEYRKNPT